MFVYLNETMQTLIMIIDNRINAEGGNTFFRDSIVS